MGHRLRVVALIAARWVHGVADGAAGIAKIIFVVFLGIVECAVRLLGPLSTRNEHTTFDTRETPRSQSIAPGASS